MDDSALNYEYLIRCAHQCGRYGVEGANADTYRRLQRNAQMYIGEKEAIKKKTERFSKQPLEDLLIRYMVSVGEVSAYIKTAIDVVKKNYDTKLTDEQYNELEKIAVLLIEPDIKKIDEAIERAEKVMLEIELYPQ
ncbi:MAG: hypothetical protein WC679_11790 [Bacteroidales bacterium]|jgi:hypothetical protein